MELTYFSTGEGAGAQFQRILAIIGICRLYGVPYVHSMPRIGHNYYDEPDWSLKWDDFFNLGRLGSPGYATVYSPPVSLDDSYFQDIRWKGVLLRVANPLGLADQAVDIFYGAARASAIHCYNTSVIPKSTSLFRLGRGNIAIHVRRENPCDTDLGEIRPGGMRHTDLKSYESYVWKLRRVFPDFDIHVFSQLDDSLDVLRETERVFLHLDADARTAFHHLVKADVLVVGKSSFSYLAGLYSEGTVFYQRFWHPPLKHWSEINEVLM